MVWTILPQAVLWLWFLGCLLNKFHLVEFLLSGHSHVSCRNTGLISCNEVLELGNLLLLSLICGFILSLLHLVNFLEVVIIAYIS